MRNFEMPTDEGEEIQIVSDSIASQPDTNPIERALSSLLAFHNRHGVAGRRSYVEEEELDEGKLNIFAKVDIG